MKKVIHDRQFQLISKEKGLHCTTELGLRMVASVKAD